MITKQQDGVVERSEVFVENQFKIKASAKAFQILSSGLYSNKVGSIIRELSANCYDSHVASNNLKTPFLVHLPNQLEPHFSVRDYGTGLSHEDIMEIYTTYFSSTKTTSNDFVGCLGVGSKSPFAYTDSFTVTSFFNGTKRVYNCFKNEQNLPSIVLLNEEPTNEHNGLEVMFSVKREDFYTFKRESEIIFQYFKLQPEVVGATFEPLKIEYLIQKNTWAIRKNTSPDYGAKAVMGNVAYGLRDYSYGDLAPKEQSILNLNIDINFNIGDLDVAASREKLSYDAVTKKNVKQRLSEIVTEITKELEDKISNCECLWDARKMVYSFKRGEYSIFSDLLRFSQITWKGTAITTTNTYTDYVGLTPMKDKVEVYMFKPHHRRYTVCITNQIPVVDKIHFFKKDITKHLAPRCTKFFESPTKNTGTDHIFMIREIAEGGFGEFKKLLGMKDTEEFTAVSTLPYDVTQVAAQNKSYNPKSRKSVFEFDYTLAASSRQEASAYWSTTEIDIENGGVYVPIERYRIYNNSPVNYIEAYKKVLTFIGVDAPVVYGIKPNELKNIQANSKWVELITYATEKVSTYFKNNSLSEFINIRRAIHQRNGEYADRNIKDGLIVNGTTLFQNDSQLQEFFDMLKIYQNSKYEEIAKAIEAVNYYSSNYSQIFFKENDANIKQYYKVYDKAIKHIRTKYPMLDLVYNISNCKAIEDYIALVQNKG
jgi:hypothetical protein